MVSALAALLVLLMATGAWATARSDFDINGDELTNNSIDREVRVSDPNVTDNPNGYYNPHGNFAGNTFACAECHRTHDAVGSKLIRRSGNTALCEACHDGTSSAYDVLEGQVNGLEGAYAGGFLKYKTVNVVSNHMRSGTTTDTAAGSTVTKVWKLECVNCHNPHGQTVTVGSYTRPDSTVQIGNDRLLESAPIAISPNDPVFGTLEPLPEGTTFHIIGDGTTTVTSATYGGPYDYGKWWKMKVDPKEGIGGQIFSGVWKTQGGAAVPTLYVVGANETVDPTVTQRVYAVNTLVRTVDVNANGKADPEDFTIVAAKDASGTINILNQGKVIKAEYRPMMTKPVALAFTNKYAYTNPAQMETVTYLSGMNFYCGTCHYDFYINMGGDGVTGRALTATTKTGQYTQAFRHAVGVEGYAWWYKNATTGPWASVFDIKIENYDATNNRGTLICQSCHYVHGSPAKSLDKDENDGTMDNSLLRADNRIVCQACHNKISENDFTNEKLLNYKTTP